MSWQAAVETVRTYAKHGVQCGLKRERGLWVVTPRRMPA